MPGAILSIRHTAKTNNAMLGEGMPWHIILPFFFLGFFLGIRNARKSPASQCQEGEKHQTDSL